MKKVFCMLCRKEVLAKECSEIYEVYVCKECCETLEASVKNG